MYKIINNNIDNTILLRQLRKHFPEMETISSDLLPFLSSVNQSYKHFDETRILLERAMEISSEELSEANRKLHVELSVHHQTLSKLKQSLISLGIDNEYLETEDLVKVSDYLNEEIDRRKKAETALKESEERWQQLVENQPEAIQISKDGIVLYMNPAGLNLYEVDTLDQIIGKDLLDFASIEMIPILQERMKIIEDKGGLESLEFPIITAKNNQKIVSVNSRSVHYNGELVIQTVVRDITERKKTENELLLLSTRLSTLINNLNSGVLLETPERMVLLTNKRLTELFGGGVTPEEFIGQDCTAIMDSVMELFKNPNEFRDKSNELIQNCETVLNQQWELVNGTIVERDFIPIFHDDIYMGNVWQYRDITDSKKAEKDLKKALESERSYNELNSNFVSMVSHEFRTPLTTIQSTTDLIINFGENFTRNELNQRVERIGSAATKMERLIENVLTIGKLESENSIIEPTHFHMSELINETINILKSGVLNSKIVDIERIGNEGQVFLDRSLIELILKNILENAAKYSPGEPNIEFVYSIENNNLMMSCKDFGIGIHSEEMSSVFESFKRGSNTSGIKGTGLGLPIVKKAIERMNGSIEISSVPDVGTIIKVCIPLNNV